MKKRSVRIVVLTVLYILFSGCTAAIEEKEATVFPWGKALSIDRVDWKWIVTVEKGDRQEKIELEMGTWNHLWWKTFDLEESTAIRFWNLERCQNKDEFYCELFLRKGKSELRSYGDSNLLKKPVSYWKVRSYYFLRKDGRYGKGIGIARVTNAIDFPNEKATDFEGMLWLQIVLFAIAMAMIGTRRKPESKAVFAVATQIMTMFMVIYAYNIEAIYMGACILSSITIIIGVVKTSKLLRMFYILFALGNPIMIYSYAHGFYAVWCIVFAILAMYITMVCSMIVGWRRKRG